MPSVLDLRRRLKPGVPWSLRSPVLPPIPGSTPSSSSSTTTTASSPPPVPRVPTESDPRRAARHTEIVADILNALARNGQLIRQGVADWEIVTAALTAADVADALGYTPVPPTVRVIAGPGLTGGGYLSSDVMLKLPEVIAPASYTIASITVDIYGRVIAASSGTATAPGGSNTHVQFNDSSAFGGVSTLTYNKTTKILTVTGDGDGATAAGPITVTAAAGNNIGCGINLDATPDAGGHNWAIFSTGSTISGGAGQLAFLDITAGKYRTRCTSAGLWQVLGSCNGSAVGPLVVLVTDGSADIGTALTLDASALTNGRIISFISTGASAAPGAGFFAQYDSGVGYLGVTKASTAEVVMGLNVYTPLGQLTVYPYQASEKGFVVKAAASQSANLIETQDNSANPNFIVRPEGWSRETLGWKRTTTNATNATSSMTNLSALSVTLVAGQAYEFEVVLFISNDVPAEGFAWDFDGGAATMTSFIASAIIYGSAAVTGFDPVTAIATDFTLGSVGTATIRVTGSMVVNAAGTFIPRFSQVAHALGTATVTTGSKLLARNLA